MWGGDLFVLFLNLYYLGVSLMLVSDIKGL